MTYLHTSLHSAPLGARPPYMNTKISSYKEKKLFTDKIQLKKTAYISIITKKQKKKLNNLF